METRSHGTQSSIGQVVNQISQGSQATFDREVEPTTRMPAEGASGTWHQNFGKFERKAATYSWTIFRPGKGKLFGHSKPTGMAEKANKQELLLDCIRRLGQKGYYEHGNRVEFRRNFSDDDNDSVKILTLHTTRYIPEPVVLDQTWLIKFLGNYYNPIVYDYQAGELFPTGGQLTPPTGMAIIPDTAKQAQAKGPFDMERKFRTEEQLLKYTDKLRLEGHPDGRIKDFYRQKIQEFHNRS